MKSRALLIILTIIVLALVLFAGVGRFATAQQPSGRLLKHAPEQEKQPSTPRLALVIGNSAYQNANRLRNSGNDAEDMAATLRELGFELVGGGPHVNQTADQMKRLILDFGARLAGTGGVGLFYYAGHGVQSQGHNYMIPVEANILRERTLEFDAVDVNRVLTEMDSAGNGFNIVILDACRSNPFTRSWRDSSQGLAQINAPEGTLIAYATSPGKVASDGSGRNGIYTAELLKQIRTPGVTIEEMFKSVRSHVRAATNNAQTPWEASSLVGSFLFTPSTNRIGGGTNSPAGETKVDPSAFELSYWESIKNSTDPEDYKDYLKRYPTGRFSDLARRRVASAIATYVNRKAAFSGERETEFIDFSFDYPSSWDREPLPGVNFVKVEKRMPGGGTLESFAVGYFNGTQDDRQQLVAQLHASHSKTVERLRKISEGDTVIGAYNGYEFRYTGQVGSPPNVVQIWGRTVLLWDDSRSRGVVLVILATSQSKDVRDVWDLGVKGEIPVILNSFKLGQ